jgi:RNA ligase
MTELQIQTLLRTQPDAFEQLDAMGVQRRAHPKWPNLVQFSYDQIESAHVRTHPLVVECRGLILDRDRNWEVVAHPFNRFFNQGEPGAADIDWSSARVQEKLDGSLMIVYWYDGAWQVATKGSPDASGNVGQHNFTFEQLFWRVWDHQYPGETQGILEPGWTYCFELTSQYNRVVTNQLGNDGQITLIGVRDQLGRERPTASLSSKLQVVPEFPLNSLAAVIAAAEVLDPAQQEGYVVVDSAWRRIKIKSPRYVLIHHLKDTVCSRRLVELAQRGETSEVFAYFPDLELKYNQIQVQLERLAERIDQWFVELQPHAHNRKQFALAVAQQIPAAVSGAMFSLLDKKYATGNQWLRSLPAQKVSEMLETVEKV